MSFRFAIVASALIAFCLAGPQRVQSAALVARFSATIVDENGESVAGAKVTISSGTVTLTGHTDTTGMVVITDVPFDTYTVSVEAIGFEPSDISGVLVAEDQSHTVRLTLRRKALPTTGPSFQPTPSATGVPSPNPSETSNPSLVHDSVLGLFNRNNPVHSAHEPFYGRYSYVLLRDGDNDVKKSNLDFLTILIDNFASTGSSIPVGGHTTPANQLSYNIFFLPVSSGVKAIKVTNHAGAALEILKSYDYDEARSIRAAYCAKSGHQDRTPCVVPLNKGPLILTFLEPLPYDVGRSTIPQAFAYDFSSVLTPQLAEPLNDIQKAIEIPSTVSADRIVPPSIGSRIANGLTAIANAISGGLSGVRAFIDVPITGNDHS